MFYPMFLTKNLPLLYRPWFLILFTIYSVSMFILIMNFEKFCAWLLRRREKKRLKKLSQRFPETAARLNPDAIEAQNALEQEQRDREELERIAKEHPEWLK